MQGMKYPTADYSECKKQAEAQEQFDDEVRDNRTFRDCAHGRYRPHYRDQFQTQHGQTSSSKFKFVIPQFIGTQRLEVFLDWMTKIENMFDSARVSSRK